MASRFEPPVVLAGCLKFESGRFIGVKMGYSSTSETFSANCPTEELRYEAKDLRSFLVPEATIKNPLICGDGLLSSSGSSSTVSCFLIARSLFSGLGLASGEIG